MMAIRRRPPRAGAPNDHSPLKIFTQIVSLQLTYYLSAYVLIFFSAMVSGERYGLDVVLNWHSLRGDTTVGWMLGMVFMLNSLTGCVSFNMSLSGHFIDYFPHLLES